jgi:molybdate transport repressor ModE-like protein
MVSAIIASAGSVLGEDKRKSTDNIGETSSIRRIIMAFRQAGIKRIVVVTGFEADVLERHCSHMGVIFLRNREFDSGDMLSSVKIGISYLKDKCDRTFISPAYIPFFSAETVKSMAAITENVVIPMCNKKAGHPLLLSASLFDRVLEYDGSGGLEDALSGEDITRKFLDVSDEGVLINTRNRSNANAVIENKSLRKIRPDARIRLMDEKPFFGPGTLHLLSLTQETRSLSQAALQMGISYSKAWKMVAAAEKQLDFKLILSKQGGHAGGSSEITKAGLEFMKRYETFLTECNEFIDASFENHFR